MLKGSDLSRSRAEAKKNDFCDVFFKNSSFLFLIRKELKAHEWGLKGSVAVELLSR